MSASKSKKKAPKLSVEEQMKKDLDNAKFLADWGFTGPNPNNCHRCGIHNSMIDGYMIQCAKCKLVYYCSMKCFNVDLESHRQFCDSGKLQSDVERVTLFDLPRTSTDDPSSKEQSMSPKSPKTPRLLGATKSSVGTSLSAQKEKPGKKKVSPKKAVKAKITPKKTTKAKEPDANEVIGAAGVEPCTITAPFTNVNEGGDIVASEGLKSPADDCPDGEPEPMVESNTTECPEIADSSSVEEVISCSAEPACSQTETELALALPDRGILSTDDVNGENREEDGSLELETPIQKQPEPISALETTTPPLEIEPPVPTKGETTLSLPPGDETTTIPTFVSPSPGDDAMASHASMSPPPCRDPSFHRSGIHDNHELAHPEPDSKESSHDKSFTIESNDDELSSCGAELSPLRSSRNWCEDDDVDVGEGRDPLENFPSVDLLSSSGHAATVSSDVTEDEETELVDQPPGTSYDEERDGSESTIIEYEEVLIEVQTYRASGSADTGSDYQDEDEWGQKERNEGDAATCDANDSSKTTTEHADELANSHADDAIEESEGSDESEASSSTIIEYEEVIIEEDVHRSSGSKPTETGLPADSYQPEASGTRFLSEHSEGEAAESHTFLDSEVRPSVHPEPTLACPTSSDSEIASLEALPTESSRHTALPTETSRLPAFSSGDSPSENQCARSTLKPLDGVVLQANQEKRSASSDDDSTGSDTTIIEYEEVIIDEDWWGVSGNVNCFDGIVYELSEEVLSRKSGSVNLAGDPGSVQGNASSDKVRQFRLVGPTSSGRYYLRPVEGESDTGEPSLVPEEEEGVGVERDAEATSDNAKFGAHAGSKPQGRRRHDGALEDNSHGSNRKLRIGAGPNVDEQERFVREVVDLKPVSPLNRPKDDPNDLRERIALRPTPPSPKQVAPERDLSFISKRSSLKEAPRTQPKSPAEIRDYSFIKKRSNLKETSPPPTKNIRSGGEHYLVFDKERKAYILRSVSGAKGAAEARDVVVLRPVKPSPKRLFEFEKPEWVKKSPIRNRGSLEGLLGQSYGNLGHSIADLNNDEPPSPRTPSRHDEGDDDDQSLGSFQGLDEDGDRAMDCSGETIYVLEDGAQEAMRRPRPAKASAGSRTTAGANVVLRPSPGSPGAKKVESKLPSWAIKSPLKTTERGLMMKSFSDLSKLGNASFSTMGSSEQAFAKPTRKSSAAYKYVSPHRYKGDYMNSMATMIESSYEPNESDAAECKALRSMPEL